MRNEDGRIVNIASTEGLGGSAGINSYTASKHGVVGLTKALAVELGPKGVTVNAVCPGPIHTGMTQYIPDEDKQVCPSPNCVETFWQPRGSGTHNSFISASISVVYYGSSCTG